MNFYEFVSLTFKKGPAFLADFSLFANSGIYRPAAPEHFHRFALCKFTILPGSKRTVERERPDREAPKLQNGLSA